MFNIPCNKHCSAFDRVPIKQVLPSAATVWAGAPEVYETQLMLQISQRQRVGSGALRYTAGIQIISLSHTNMKSFFITEQLLGLSSQLPFTNNRAQLLN